MIQGNDMNIFDFNVMDRAGNKISLNAYKGKVIMVINSATQCGFTPQYSELQRLYEKYADRGFVILDFPCNQFFNQAPESNEEIHHFCESTYGVTFPIFAKINVKGADAHPLFKYLTGQKSFAGFDEEHPLTQKVISKISAGDPEFDKNPEIKWNFTKFLIDREGNVVERFEPTKALQVVENRIEELL